MRTRRIRRFKKVAVISPPTTLKSKTAVSPPPLPAAHPRATHPPLERRHLPPPCNLPPPPFPATSCASRARSPSCWATRTSFLAFADVLGAQC